MIPTYLPATFVQAIVRGLKCRCPRCGGAPLFARWLKPVAACPACAQDWTYQKADDFPAYIAILLTGHLLGFLVIPLVTEFDLSVPALIAIFMGGAVVLMLYACSAFLNYMEMVVSAALSAKRLTRYIFGGYVFSATIALTT